MTHSLPAPTLTAPQQALVRAWAALAVGALAVSTLFALALVLLRTPLGARWLAGHDPFHMALALHVNLSVLVWFGANAGLVWTLGARPRALHTGWAALALSAGGALAMLAAPFVGSARPVMSNYVPVLASPVFLGGLASLGAAAGLLGARALVLAAPRASPGGVSRAARLLWWAAAVPTLLAVLSFAWSWQAVPSLAGADWHYEAVFWGGGHTLQFAYVLLMMGAWLVLAEAGGGRLPATPVVALLGVLAVLPSLLVPVIHYRYPVFSADYRVVFTHLMSWGSWPAALVLGLLVAFAVVRARAFTAAGIAFLCSFLLFCSGLVVGSLIRQDNALVPAHYHGTVGGVTLAFMGLILHLLPRLGLAASDPRRARRQPVVYGGGLLLVVVGLTWSGLRGGTRKLPLADWSAAELAPLALTTLGGLLGVAGALLFFQLVFRAWGQRSARSTANLSEGIDAGGGGAVLRPAASRRVDRRRLALALTAGMVALGGIAVHLLPGSGPGGAVVVSGAPGGDPARHADEARQAEVRARFDQAVVMLHAKQYEHAMTALHRVLELAPEMPEAHVNMGYALLGLKRYREALDFFNGATGLRAEQANAYYGMAVALDALGDREAALGAMRTYVHRTAPDDPYLPKARAALWEWETALAKARGALPGNEKQ